jgi:NADH:ubiquinone oxidoreductase subunit 6 (subunit J)
MLLSSNNQKFYLSIFFLFFVLLVGFYYSFSFINFFFSFLIITFSFFVAYSKSIVSSVLSLIGLASVFSLVLFGYGATFLAVLYLAVYIGAVAVFFLFVVMMTDLSDESLTSNFSVKRPTFLSIFFCFLLASFFVFIFYIGFNFSDSFKSSLV